MKQAQGQLDILVTIARLLDRHHIPFLLSGSIAVSFWGYPRATHDIDFVLELSQDQKHELQKTLSTLSRDFLQDVSDLTHETTFYSLYYSPISLKVDLWFEGKQDFQREWGRRRRVTMQGVSVSLVSAEDLILTKLSWCKKVWSDRHFRDCVGMWLVQKGKLDEKYLSDQAKKVGVASLLSQVIATKEY
ncbi:MAG: hypothetical protein UY48_C0015G0006 [Candidatus Gottesmanbacteria bacterium GW2011_GWB1_49_7]|uniref:Nucleotidyltransferase family protein n=1 Tax=Candidatus Gottesmanbacteria bacterium GW2011_GWB1_49_7 TaxID=1618448 RepID=A0A0G1VZ71_9BACT|nr:MAG: hypothetical protein UY49_C0014G0002 [Microgenomates group bacterium GW2011_GWC1_49_7]KKW11600.1 MAG: hypothetical protein UY48_C0015G0006 [Candidatus Gottesmanbacteria bacterium GW2011_GWB1_49_7]